MVLPIVWSRSAFGGADTHWLGVSRGCEVGARPAGRLRALSVGRRGLRTRLGRAEWRDAMSGRRRWSTLGSAAHEDQGLVVGVCRASRVTKTRDTCVWHLTRWICRRAGQVVRWSRANALHQGGDARVRERARLPATRKMGAACEVGVSVGATRCRTIVAGGHAAQFVLRRVDELIGLIWYRV